jgi:hypothetical protein
LSDTGSAVFSYARGNVWSLEVFQMSAADAEVYWKSRGMRFVFDMKEAITTVTQNEVCSAQPRV